MSTKPDLSETRQHAEAVAYGKLLATREILDALAKEKPHKNPSWGYYGNTPEQSRLRHIGIVAGYQQAVAVVKAMRLGVEKS